MGDFKSLISKIEKTFEKRVQNRNQKIFDIVKGNFDSIESFQKTERDGEEILLDTFIEKEETPDQVKIIIKTNKNPDRIKKLLEQDEKGVGSLNIEPKASKYKLISRSKADIFTKLKGSIKE